MMSDLTDGTIARIYGLETKEGAVIDPMSDKLLQIPALFYLVFLGLANFWIILTYTIVDFLGQFLHSNGGSPV